MFALPLDQLKEKVMNEAKLSEEELQKRIKKKMDELAGLVSEEGAAHIVANELGVQVFSGSVSVKIAKLNAGMRNVEVFGKVMRKFDVKEFNSARGPGKVGSFVLGDETGTARVVLWQEQADKLAGLSEGMIIKISSGYMRDNNGRLELHLNDRSKITPNPEGVKIEVPEMKERENAPRKTIAELKEEDQNVEILVTLVDVFDPRYFSVCPECNRRVMESNGAAQCATHGTVKAGVSYVVNALGDDGTDTIRIVLWKNQAERLLGLANADMLKFKDYPELFQDVKHKMLGEVVKLVGGARKNTMFDRLEFNAQLVFLNPDPKEEIKRLEK